MASVISSVKLTFICTSESFRPLSTEGVRWLAPQADFYRFEQMLLTRGVDPPKYEAWLEWHRQGYGFAAHVDQGTVLSIGTVMRQPEGDWLLAGVRTLDKHTGNGYAAAVSSFITKYVLRVQGRCASSLTDNDAPMRHILQKLGYSVVDERRL